ncbi:MAG: hypothetical protein ABIZ09_10825 [Rhodoferax sp.]
MGSFFELTDIERGERLVLLNHAKRGLDTAHKPDVFPTAHDI